MSSPEPLSVKWLAKAQNLVNEDPAFRKLGSIDVDMALRVGNTLFMVNFAGFTCHGVAKLDPTDVRDADFVVEMTPAQWSQFVAGRARGDGPTLAELDTTDGVVRAEHPRKKLDFLRYHTSLQAFIDAGARGHVSQAA